MNFGQRALRFSCKGSSLIGVVDVPARPLQRGVLVLTGTRQYRVGGHRQFALLARTLAPRGLPVMRFDCRGIGDSEGAPRRYDTLADDVRAALKELFTQIPELQEVVVWGLDDAATAAALYAHSDPRVKGLVLLNPWMRHPATGERAALMPNLRARLGEFGFWRKIAAGLHDGSAAADPHHNQRAIAGDANLPLRQRMIASLACFEGKTLIILGGADPQAKDFADLLDRHPTNARRVTISGANHSFASREWRDEVADICANWVVSW